MALALIRRKFVGVAPGLGARAMCSPTVAGPEPVTLPELPYAYSALEPHISGEIMELHHSKHHKTYVNNYNKALEQWQAAHERHDSASVPAVASALHFNGGGAPLTRPLLASPPETFPCRRSRAPSTSSEVTPPWLDPPPILAAWALLSPLTRSGTERDPVLRGERAGHVNHSIFWKNLCPEKARSFLPRNCQLVALRAQPARSLESLRAIKALRISTCACLRCVAAGLTTLPLEQNEFAMLLATGGRGKPVLGCPALRDLILLEREKRTCVLWQGRASLTVPG